MYIILFLLYIIPLICYFKGIYHLEKDFYYGVRLQFRSSENLISFLNYLLENFILNLLFIVILTLALLLPILNFFIFSSLKMCFIKNPYKAL